MTIAAEQVQCRFYLSSVAQHGLSPLYEWILEQAHHQGLRGGTAIKGFYGVGPGGAVLEERTWSLSQDLPVIVEVVDEAAKIERFLAKVEPAFRKGVITLTNAAAGVRTMKLPEQGALLRIFIGESDKEPGSDRPLYEAIVRKAKEAQLGGATVLRGQMGFGRHSRVHTAKLFDLSTDLPVVIEIVDAAEKIETFLPTVNELVSEGLVTLETVRILRYVSPDHR